MTELEKLLREALEENKKLKKQIEVLMKENAELKARLGMNSTNSSMPPSSDKFSKKKDKTKSLRQKSDKPSGGQQGHKGTTLEKVADPDIVIDIPHDNCIHCNSEISAVPSDEIKTRQVFDIPEIKILATEYRVHSKICPHCAKKSASQFPENITHQTQYGENIKALITNLNVYQALPYKRIKEFLSQFFDLNLSEGTIYNTLRKAYSILESVETQIKDALIKSEIAHADETGSNVDGKNHWIHSFSSDKLTYLFPHPNRGKKAILEAGVLSSFHGILTRDCWSAYDRFNHFTSALCCVHLLRELNYLDESTKFKFPGIIKGLLLEMKNLLESKSEVSELQKSQYYFKYVWAVEEGLLEESIANPFHLTQCDKAGRKKRSKAYNLLKRLERTDDVLRFFLENNPALFTNNAAERDIRNIKIKNKISGVFRSESGLKYHCRIRGYISSVIKNGLNTFDSLKSIFTLGDTVIPIMS